jgi:hypothetical protein
MKTVSAIARYLAGVIFRVFGMNGFLNFISLPPPGGIAGQLMSALYASHYLWGIFAFQVIAAVLLLVNGYVALHRDLGGRQGARFEFSTPGGDRQVTSEGFSILPTFSGNGKTLYYLVRFQANRRFVSGELWPARLSSPLLRDGTRQTPAAGPANFSAAMRCPDSTIVLSAAVAFVTRAAVSSAAVAQRAIVTAKMREHRFSS